MLFTTRSTKGIKRLSSLERASINLPDEIKEILIGILLGDAHMVRRSSTANSRLVYAQTAISHKEYFYYVLSFFFTFCTTDYIPQSRVVKDKRTNQIYSAICFTTMQLPCFNVFREMFYLSNIKIVPYNIYDLLTPRGLAFWLMDDGSRHGYGMHIGVYAFSSADIDKLMFTLPPGARATGKPSLRGRWVQDKFNLRCSIHYNNENKPRIYIFKESMDTLISLVKPYFIKEMLYKLGL